MSRLWIDHNTDNRGHGGKNYAETAIYYGSAKNSMCVARIIVEWSDSTDKPKLTLLKGEEINVFSYFNI